MFKPFCNNVLRRWSCVDFLTFLFYVNTKTCTLTQLIYVVKHKKKILLLCNFSYIC